MRSLFCVAKKSGAFPPNTPPSILSLLKMLSLEGLVTWRAAQGQYAQSLQATPSPGRAGQGRAGQPEAHAEVWAAGAGGVTTLETCTSAHRKATANDPNTQKVYRSKLSWYKCFILPFGIHAREPPAFHVPRAKLPLKVFYASPLLFALFFRVLPASRLLLREKCSHASESVL